METKATICLFQVMRRTKAIETKKRSMELFRESVVYIRLKKRSMELFRESVVYIRLKKVGHQSMFSVACTCLKVNESPMVQKSKS